MFSTLRFNLARLFKKYAIFRIILGLLGLCFFTLIVLYQPKGPMANIEEDAMGVFVEDELDLPPEALEGIQRAFKKK